jgi:hypothetical protein
MGAAPNWTKTNCALFLRAEALRCVAAHALRVLLAGSGRRRGPHCLAGVAGRIGFRRAAWVRRNIPVPTVAGSRYDSRKAINRSGCRARRNAYKGMGAWSARQSRGQREGASREGQAMKMKAKRDIEPGELVTTADVEPCPKVFVRRETQYGSSVTSSRAAWCRSSRVT